MEMKMNEEYLCKIEDYKKVRHEYEKMTSVIEKILKKAVNAYAPKSSVEVRTKTLGSYAEKIVRKGIRNSNPLDVFTDLTGARVITQSQDQLEDICDFIEHYFTIDYTNSMNKLDVMKNDQFGYMSVHYIVELPEIEKIFGVKICKESSGKKAEIQVRTVLQHVWSEMDHDRFYKASFEVPESLKRDDYRLAAVIENTDHILSELVSKIDYYENNFSAFTSRKKIEHELEVISVLNHYEENAIAKTKLHLKECRLLALLERWDELYELIQDLDYKCIFESPFEKLEYEYLFSVSGINSQVDNVDVYTNCQRKLENISLSQDGEFVSSKEKTVKLRAMIQLAKSYEFIGNSDESKKLYYEAYKVDSENPYIIGKCVKLFKGIDNYEMIMMPMLNKGIEVCDRQIEALVELPYAYFLKGRFKYLKQDFIGAYHSYIDGYHFCMNNDVSATVTNSIFIEEQDFYRGETINEQSEVIQALFNLFCEDRYSDDVNIVGEKFVNSDIIKDPLIEEFYNEHKDMTVSDDLKSVLGFSRFIQELSGQDKQVRRCFYFLGVDSCILLKIKLLLSMNLPVVIINKTEIMSEYEKIDGEYDEDNTFIIPYDKMSLYTFYEQYRIGSISKSSLDEKQLEIAARRIHENYLKKVFIEDPSHKEWELLNPELRNANINQLLFIEQTLKIGGYGIREATGQKFMPFDDVSLLKMAEYEHGRWVSSRIINGWVYDDEKNISKKTSPYIVPWEDLSDEIRQYDFDAINGFSEILGMIGLESFRL